MLLNTFLIFKIFLCRLTADALENVFSHVRAEGHTRAPPLDFRRTLRLNNLRQLNGTLGSNTAYDTEDTAHLLDSQLIQVIKCTVAESGRFEPEVVAVIVETSGLEGISLMYVSGWLVFMERNVQYANCTLVFFPRNSSPVENPPKIVGKY